MAETDLKLCRVHFDPATGLLWRWDGLLFRPLLDPFVSFYGANHVGLGGYPADATNGLGVQATNIVFDNEGNSVRALFNKAAAGDDASFGFETGYSARALIGLLGDDDFHFKVSPDGSTYYEAIVIDRNTGAVTFPVGVLSASPNNVNLLINGDHVVSQAVLDTAVTGIGAAGGVATYVTDQWQILAKGSLRVSGQRISSLSLPGFLYALRTTVTTAQASLGSGDYLQISQPIEGLHTARLGFGASGAKAIGIGFYIRSSITGTFALELTNSARNRSICKLLTIAAANTWTWVSFSGASSISGDTSGSWLVTNGVGLRLGITLCAGSGLQGTADAWSGADVMTTSAQTNFAATGSATFDITAAAMFMGDALLAEANAGFNLRPFAEEYALCQRYWEKSYNYSTAVGAASILGNGLLIASGALAGSTAGNVGGANITPSAANKRTQPALTLYDYDGTANAVRVFPADAKRAGVTTVFNTTEKSNFQYLSFDNSSATAISAGNVLSYNWTSNARLA